MLALFAARPYIPPLEALQEEDGLKSCLTNTCLQDSNEREGSVSLFWDLPDVLPSSSTPVPTSTTHKIDSTRWKQHVFSQICQITGETFEAAARSMSIHFQPLPNAFELFGLDFMIGVENETGQLRTWLLEVNAFPDFRQTGVELRGVVEGLFEGVVDVAVGSFFGLGAEGGVENGMTEVLDIDLGRR